MILGIRILLQAAPKTDLFGESWGEQVPVSTMRIRNIESLNCEAFAFDETRCVLWVCHNGGSDEHSV